jgi:hypothetical protein
VLGGITGGSSPVGGAPTIAGGGAPTIPGGGTPSIPGLPGVGHPLDIVTGHDGLLNSITGAGDPLDILGGDHSPLSLVTGGLGGGLSSGLLDSVTSPDHGLFASVDGAASVTGDLGGLVH